MPGSKRSGLTLIEMLVSMVMIVFVLGALLSLYLSAVRSYAVQTADCSAQAQACWALRSALPYIREVRNVTQAEPDYLRFHVVDPGATIPYVGTGDEMCIYPGDENGSPDTASGEYLWLAVNHGGEMTPVELLAKDIAPGTGLQFQYVLDNGSESSSLGPGQLFRLRAIRMKVTTVQHTHGGPRHVIQEGAAALRSYSPK